MSFADTRQAIEDQLKTELATSQPTLAVQYANAPFERPERAIYARVTIAEPVGARETIGATSAALFRHRGLVTVDVLAPERTDAIALAAVADSISAALKEAKLTQGASGNIRCEVPRLIPIGLNDDGWYQEQVLTEYSRCLVG